MKQMPWNECYWDAHNIATVTLAVLSASICTSKASGTILKATVTQRRASVNFRTPKAEPSCMVTAILSLLFETKNSLATLLPRQLVTKVCLRCQALQGEEEVMHWSRKDRLGARDQCQMHKWKFVSRKTTVTDLGRVCSGHVCFSSHFLRHLFYCQM